VGDRTAKTFLPTDAGRGPFAAVGRFV
jgi:hypothetical protein